MEHHPGISFFIDLEDEVELNRLAAALAEGGMVHMPAGNTASPLRGCRTALA